LQAAPFNFDVCHKEYHASVQAIAQDLILYASEGTGSDARILTNPNAPTNLGFV